jgi:hypothetical protein
MNDRILRFSGQSHGADPLGQNAKIRNDGLGLLTFILFAGRQNSMFGKAGERKKVD